jgi:hypothetical protein
MSLPARQFGRCGKQGCWTRQQPIIQATRNFCKLFVEDAKSAVSVATDGFGPKLCLSSCMRSTLIIRAEGIIAC